MIIFLKIVFLIILPSLLSICAETEFITNFLLNHQLIGKNFNIDFFNDLCFCLSIFLSGIMLGIDDILVSKKIKKKNKQVDALLLYCKEILCKTLSEVWGIDGNIGVNIRVFVPDKKFLFFIERISILNKMIPLYYKIKNIPAWAETRNTDRLKLRVNYEPQGLVGQCYASKNMIFDNNLKINNANNYKLNKSQIDQTRELTFSICIPILDPNDNIVAIVAYDSIETLMIDDRLIDSDKTKIPLITFARRMYEIAPEIFK